MSGLTIVSPRGLLSGSSLEAELEFRTAQLRKSGGRRSFVDVVGAIEEDTVLRILAAARLGARIILLHPRWTDEERSRNLARIQGGPAPKRGTATGEFVLFTSGTGGEPKAVELSAAGFEVHGKAAAKRLQSTKEDRWLLTLTPAHVGGLAIILRAHFQASTLVVPPNPIPRD
ncbi:MAG TPA: AMP-binding protein, partial [Candidatus Thermoplasmatota archaeon]